jgi:hypothetical protein
MTAKCAFSYRSTAMRRNLPTACSRTPQSRWESLPKTARRALCLPTPTCSHRRCGSANHIERTRDHGQRQAAPQSICARPRSGVFVPLDMLLAWWNPLESRACHRKRTAPGADGGGTQDNAAYALHPLDTMPTPPSARPAALPD